MNSLAIGKQYDTQIPAVHLGNRRPATDAAIGLHDLPRRMRDDVLNPVEADETPVGALAHRLEIARELHGRLQDG